MSTRGPSAGLGQGESTVPGGLLGPGSESRSQTGCVLNDDRQKHVSWLGLILSPSPALCS